MNPNSPYSNELIHESSPYLLQHANNPVKWHAWRTDVLQKAQNEGKLLLISIGYAACHWCHVMEHECFEDEDVAKVMNQHFVNIKVDREERPDVDHIYMDALQMMTGSGGWPLNVVALPDGRPFWGATYVKKSDWITVLDQLVELYKTDQKKVVKYAEDLSAGLHSINLIEPSTKAELISKEDVYTAVKEWSKYFDTFLGGYKRAPKFMMPVNLDFLLHYATLSKDEVISDYVHTTLVRMAYGGIYDHLGGGFSRYSTDVKWHVPHFEKMLYDNAQLVSLYAKAYAASKEPLYRNVAEESISFVRRELMAAEGAFFSSLDADSLDKNGVLNEGAFYVWTERELADLLKEEYPLFKDYYNINSYGLWEDGNYVLIRDTPDKEIAKKHGLTEKELRQKIEQGKTLLLNKRETRPKPRLDDKILTSWNAMMIKALAEAYRYLGKESYLKLAIKASEFLEKSVQKKDGSLYHNHKEGKSTVEGFLEDYANLIDAWLSLYESTFDESWVNKAKKLMDYCLSHFLDTKSGLFYFTSDTSEKLVRRSFETADNVIPASNSVMARMLYSLSLLYPQENYGSHCDKMIRTMSESLLENPNSHANWLHLPLYRIFPFREVVVTGLSARKFSNELRKKYLPNVLLAGTEEKSSLSLLENRFHPTKTQFYICEHGSCKLPVNTPEEAIEILEF